MFSCMPEEFSMQYVVYACEFICMDTFIHTLLNFAHNINNSPKVEPFVSVSDCVV